MDDSWKGEHLIRAQKDEQEPIPVVEVKKTDTSYMDRIRGWLGKECLGGCGKIHGKSYRGTTGYCFECSRPSKNRFTS